MFFGTARPTSAAKVFEDRDSLRAEVEEYCRSPSEYEKYGPIEKWNVSAVTNMDRLFRGLSSCSPDISKWKVGAVKTFVSIFFTHWNVISAVTFVHYCCIVLFTI